VRRERRDRASRPEDPRHGAFGIEYPVVQTGMGYVSDARLTAATSAAGGLGIIGGGLDVVRGARHGDPAVQG